MEITEIIVAGAWAFAIATSLSKQVTGLFMGLSYIVALLISLGALLTGTN